MKSLITISILLCFRLPCSAQHVNSTSFQLTLDALLEKDVPMVDAKVAMLEGAVILDARERSEFEVSHIKSAKWIGANLENSEILNELAKDQKVIVYCSIGYRSEMVTRKLRAEGFSEAYNLFGGIFEWKNRNFPVYKNNVPTDSVHAYSYLWGIWLNKGTKVYE